MLSKRRSGFTLIELLIVIAIIAILAAILFPVFAAARERARTAACSSNVSQISKALKMYETDNSKFPPIDGGVTQGEADVTWLRNLMLTSYLKNKGAAYCPSQTMGRSAENQIWGGYYPFGYAINSNICEDWGGGGYGISPESIAREPSKTILIGDANWNWFAYDFSENSLLPTRPDAPDGSADGVRTPNWWSGKVAWRHPKSRRPRPANTGGNGSSNFAMLDGHVALLKQAATSPYIPIGYRLYP